MDAGYRVVAFARRDSRPPALRFSKHVHIVGITAPETSLSRALTDLTEVLDKLETYYQSRPCAAMPVDDAALWLLDALHAETQIPIAGATGKLAELALNKKLQVEQAKEAGFLVPDTKYVKNSNDVFDALKGYPVHLKSAKAMTNRNDVLVRMPSWVCANRNELQNTLKAWGHREPLLLQPFIAGVGTGLFGFALPDRIIMWSAHERVRMMNPHGSGSSACRSIPVDPFLQQAATRFLMKSRWQGLFMIELLRDHEGNVWFMELNGRCWGSMALARRLGLEYPAWAVQATLGKNPDFAEPTLHKRSILCRHLGRELMHILFVLRGPKSSTFTNWPSLWKTLHDVLYLKKGEHWYNYRKCEWRVFVSNIRQTICEQIFKGKR